MAVRKVVVGIRVVLSGSRFRTRAIRSCATLTRIEAVYQAESFAADSKGDAAGPGPLDQLAEGTDLPRRGLAAPDTLEQRDGLARLEVDVRVLRRAADERTLG